MRMVDLIAKKKRGERLSGEEIAFFIRRYASGEIPDYQASAMTMAICFSGMDAAETADMTMEMARSGELVDLSEIPGVKADKHSTGGVGDKTTLVVAPIVASLGVPVAKMSGRGLGHTGGTIDKLEAIPGYNADLSKEEFISCVKKAGVSIAGQSGNLAPADKKLYALRDATATVNSIPLIASSVMSKKIAAGADVIVLDVKMGSGAFIKTPEDAEALARQMVAIGDKTGRKTVALITDMDVPLGHCIGNSLEVIEAVETLKGEGPADLSELCLTIAAEMLSLAGMGMPSFCRELAENTIRDGSALEKLKELVRTHGGDDSYIGDVSRFPKASVRRGYAAPADGFISHMDAEGIGAASMLLGAGRKHKGDIIDHGAGIMLKRKTGDAVKSGDVLAIFHTGDESRLNAARSAFADAVEIGTAPPVISGKIVHARIGAENL